MPFLGKVPSQLVDSDVDIDGGSIDGVSIGSVTANAGAFTNLTATGTLTLPDDGISGDDVNGGTISSFASTGIDDNATSTAITIDSSENVIVGRTSLSASGLGVATGKNITFSEGSSASYANMYRQNNSGGLMLANGYQYGDGTNGNHSSVGSSFAKTLIGLRNGGIYFYADAAATASIGTQVTATEIMRVTPDGLTFNGDTAAANALDDYEEGTYTAEYKGSANAGSTTYSRSTGVYTKIGRTVTVWVDMTITAQSGATGHATITLPFASGNNYGTDAHGNTRFDMGGFIPWAIADTFTNTKQGTGWITNNSAHMAMYYWNTGGHGSLSGWSLNTTGRISGKIIYTAA